MAQLSGIFVERPDDLHVRLRRQALEHGASLAPTPVATGLSASAAIAVEQARPALAERGAAVVELDEPLDQEELLRLGELLGEPIAETDPTVLPRVDRQFILNLRSSDGFTSDVADQPFTTSPLTLHTEGSRRPLDAQPRYVVLLCHEPGSDATAAETVLMPMDAVAAALDRSQRSILSQTSLHDSGVDPAILREEGGGAVFSFRDFGDKPLTWTYRGDDALPGGGEAVENAIQALLAALYAPHRLVGIDWRRGTLAIIDNRRVFHGRTAGSRATVPPFRHLARLRIR